MSLGIRLESLRGSMPIGDFARMFGIHKNTYSNYVKRENVPDATFITAVCQKFGVSANWLLMGIGPTKLDQEAASGMDKDAGDLADYLLIPLIETWITDPEGEIIHDGIIEHVPFKRRWIDRLKPSGDGIKYLILTRARGNSMIPTINPGDVMLLDTCLNCRTLTNTGDIYMVRLPDGERALKRVAVQEQQEGVSIILFSDNTIGYRPITFSIETVGELHRILLGRILWIGREFLGP